MTGNVRIRKFVCQLLHPVLYKILPQNGWRSHKDGGTFPPEMNRETNEKGN